MPSPTNRLLVGVAVAAITVLAGCATPSAPRDAAAPTVETAATATPAQPASRPVLDLPHVQTELANGLRVIAIRTPTPGTVSIQIPVQTGSRNEVEPGKSGFAHFFEHMMFRGTPKYPADAYAAAVQAAGGDQNAFTDDDWTNYYINATTADLEKLIEIEADRFMNLAYTEEQFRTEALAVKGEYLKNYANPLLKGFERLQALAFTAHTYRHTTMGFLEDIDDMPNELAYSREFFQRWYRPEYTSVIIAGDIDLAATVALVEKHWGGWQRGSHTVDVPTEPAQTAPRYEHLPWAGPTLPWMLVAWKSPAFTVDAVDTAALDVIGEMHFGRTSELYEDLVVKRQLVDTLQVSPARSRDPGLFTLALRLTAPEHAPEVVAAIDQALLRVRAAPVDPTRLDATRSRLRYALASSMNSAAGTAAVVASFVHYGRDVATLERYFSQLDALDGEDLLAVGNRVFADAHRNVVSIARGDALAGADGFAALDGQVDAARARFAAEPVATDANPAWDPPQGTFAAEREANNNDWGARNLRIMVPVIELPSDSPLVDLIIEFETGAGHDPAGKKGLAQLAASLVTQTGSPGRTAQDYQRALYPMAAQWSVRVDKHVTRFEATVHRDRADDFWRVVDNQFFNRTWTDEDFDRVRRQQINQIRVSLRGNNDEELAKEVLHQDVYGPDHPYGTLSLGDVSDLESIDAEDVREFMRQHYVLRNLRVGFAGDAPQAFVDHVLGDMMVLPTTDRAPITVAEPARATSRAATIIAKPTSGVAVSFGLPIAVDRADPDWLALWVARSWLGEHRSTAGRLFNRIREERGLNYGAYAYTEYFPNGMYLMKPETGMPREVNLFEVWIRPLRNNNDAVFATRVALNEVQQMLAEGISAADFVRTREFLRKYVRQLTATQRARLGYAMDWRRVGVTDFVAWIDQGFEPLSPDQVNAALRRHIDPRGFRFVFVSPDADGLRSLLTSGKATPIEYNTPRDAALTAEDAKIARLPLNIPARNVRVLAEPDVFE